MQNDDNLIDHFGSFLETSSVLAHDISGQNHVAQFCVEELSHLVEGEGEKYISRLKSSLDEIAELTALYRKIVRGQNPKKLGVALRSVHDEVEQLLQLYYFKEKEHIDFSFSGSFDDLSTELAINPYDLQQILFASYVLFVDAMQLGQIEKQLLAISAQEDSKQVTMSIIVKSQAEFLEQIKDLMDKEGPFVGKTFRRTKALEVFKKALKAESEAVRINLHCENQTFSINLVFNKKK